MQTVVLSWNIMFPTCDHSINYVEGQTITIICFLISSWDGWAHVSHSPAERCWTRWGWPVSWPLIFLITTISLLMQFSNYIHAIRGTIFSHVPRSRMVVVRCCGLSFAACTSFCGCMMVWLLIHGCFLVQVSSGRIHTAGAGFHVQICTLKLLMLNFHTS